MKIPLKELRENKKMTQADLGKKLNIAASTVGMWEQGRRNPDCENLKRISKIFGVTIDYLLNNEIVRQEVFNEDETKLVYNYRKLNTERKSLIKRVLLEFIDCVKKAEESNTAPNIVQNNHHNNGGTNILNVGNLVRN